MVLDAFAESKILDLTPPRPRPLQNHQTFATAVPTFAMANMNAVSHLGPVDIDNNKACVWICVSLLPLTNPLLDISAHRVFSKARLHRYRERPGHVYLSRVQPPPLQQLHSSSLKIGYSIRQWQLPVLSTPSSTMSLFGRYSTFHSSSRSSVSLSHSGFLSGRLHWSLGSGAFVIYPGFGLFWPT